MTDMNLVLAAIIALVNGKNWNALLLACSKLLNSGCKDARLYFFTGLAHWKLGNKNEAVQGFNLALEIDPDVDNASYANTCIALTYRRMATQADGPVNQSLIQAALERFHRALQLDPKGRHGDHATSIAGCLALMGALEQAIEWYNWALANGCHRPEECLYNKATILNTLNRHAEAYETYRQLAERNPEHVRATLWMAKIQLSANVNSGSACVAETIETALPALERLVDEAQSSSNDTRLSYMVRPNEPALRHKEGRLDAAIQELSEAHGLAAIAAVHLQDWARAETHVRASYSRGKHSQTSGYALWLCKEYQVPGSTELYVRITEEFETLASSGGLGSARLGTGSIEIDDHSGEIAGLDGSQFEHGFTGQYGNQGDSGSDFELSTYGAQCLEGDSGSDFDLSALDAGADFDPTLGLGVSPSDSNIPVGKTLARGQHTTLGVAVAANSVNNPHSTSTAAASGIGDALLV